MTDLVPAPAAALRGVSAGTVRVFPENAASDSSTICRDMSESISWTSVTGMDRGAAAACES
jgi:hypothetical protein